ncbi:MAG: hypothetical protein Q7S59_02250 [Sulfurimonas sp.]|nr:hypothetical protein [Sulfurimonas sp.]
MKIFFAFCISLVLVSAVHAYSVGDKAFVYYIEEATNFEYPSENATTTTGNYTGYSIQVIVLVPPQTSSTQDIMASIIDSYGGVLYEIDSGYLADGSKLYLMRTDAFHYYGTLSVVTWDNTSHSSGRWKDIYTYI